MQKQQKIKTYVAYMKDTTQDTQFKRINPQTGSYVRRGETVPRYNDLNMLKSYFMQLVAINNRLRFQIRDADTDTVVWQA